MLIAQPGQYGHPSVSSCGVIIMLGVIFGQFHSFLLIPAHTSLGDSSSNLTLRVSNKADFLSNRLSVGVADVNIAGYSMRSLGERYSMTGPD